jgi:DNA polymerase-3 subunit epsilon
MNHWLTRLFRPRTELDPGVVRRLDTWRALPAISERTPLAELRMLIVDVETTGLDPRRDRLLAIGAVSFEQGRLRSGAGFEVLLRHEETSPRENILVHGIGPQEQARGQTPEQALLAFLEYAGKSPLVGYHAPFDEAVLGRALRATLGVRLPNPFIDLVYLCPRLFPEAGLKRASLDDWLDHFGLRAHARHRAVYDSLATGELCLILLHRAMARGITTLGALRAAAEAPAVFSAGGGVGGA